MNHKTVKKMLALAVCVIFVMVTFLSSAYVLMHTQHEHAHDGPGGNCTACAYVVVAGNLLKLLAGALVCVALGVGLFAAICAIIKGPCVRAALFTLVHQRIKMNI